MLPGLAGITKAMFSAGRFVGLEGEAAVLALPNDMHRQKCEQKRADVERVLSDRLGSPVTLRLVVDSAAGGPVAVDVPDEDHLGGADVHDLDDAPDAPTGGLGALQNAFPGAELIEER